MHTRHHRPTIGLAVASFVLATASAATADIVFVNAAQVLPTFSQSGTSWALAFKSLATALANAQPGDEVWVAGGVYKPTTTTLQTVSFTPPDGVRVLGGFTVGDTLESDRDPIGNPTVLSGEIGAPGNADNSLHILRATSVAGTEIDGFIFSAGNADGAVSDGIGGAVLVDGPLSTTDITFRDCRFLSNNAVSFGGAVAVRTDGVVLVDCVFMGNSSSNGGGLDVQNGSAWVANCRFLGNDAGLGGAVSISAPGGSTFQNCLFSGNTGNGGGAIAVNSGTVVVESSTFVNNAVSATAGAIMNSASGNVQLRNSILWGNTANGFPNQVGGAGANFPKFSCDIQGASSDAQGNFSADPLFVNALGADGVAGTEDDDLRLRANSPCVDRGDSSLIFADFGDVDADGNISETLPTDLDGKARLRDDLVDDTGSGTPSHLDLGAYETKRPGTTICVDDSAAAGGDGSTWAKSLTSLQSALSIVNAQALEAPVRIWIAKGTYKPTTTTDRSVSFKVTKSVGIYGGFAGGEGSLLDRFPQVNPTTLSGDIGVAGTTSDNSFHVVDVALPPAGTTTLDGVFVTAGNANGGTAPVNGGGIRVAGGTGGVGALVVRGCRLFRNLGVTGAGLGATGSTQTQIVNCHIAGNQSTGGGGGVAAAASTTTVQLVNCTVLGNLASVGGGAIAQGGGTIAALNSILYFNDASSAVGEGDQIANVGGAGMSLSHCCVQCLGVVSSAGTVIDSIGENPTFIEPSGSDGVFGTSDDVVLLRNFSPCTDSGTTSGLPSDIDDIDEDGSARESLPFDIILHGNRQFDDTSVPNGAGGIIDMGAVERQNASFGAAPNPADLDGDGVVGQVDLALLLGAFGSTGPVGDVDFDCAVDAADLALLLGAWTG